ncbi:MAG: hypothetical protein U0271_38110 [Polyangiaceae bacterium]
MAQFDFHATFDDLVEILRDMLEHRGVRIVIPALDGTTSNEPIEHAVIDDDVKAMLRASNSVWLTGPFTPRPLPLEPRKDVPGRFALKMGSCLSLRIGREDARTIWDSTLACQGSLPKFDATELENAFDDVVEGSVRPRLLRCDDGGVRYWITRQVPEARSAGRSLTFGGSRRRSLGMNIRIAHQRIGQRDRAGNQHATGLVSYTRGSRGTVAIARADLRSDGPGEELFIN